MNTEQLLRYYEELHYALDRELVDFPRDNQLQEACRELEERLSRVPGGEELLDIARKNVTSNNDRVIEVFT